MTKLLISHRPIWLLDEPTAALDKQSTTVFAQIVDDYLSAGGIVIAATHLPLGFQESKVLEMKKPDISESVF